MKRNGFTLIELLVVIFIIGILAGILLPNFVSSRERARDSRRKHDLAEIKTALRLYYNDNQAYPPAGGVPFGNSWSPYMQRVPQDSLAPNQTYGYCVAADRESFLLFALLENRGDPDLTRSANNCNVSEWSAAGCDLSNCYNGSINLCYYVCAD